MSATPVDSFVSTCEANDVPCTHATPEEFREVLAPMLDQPAVGVALRDPDASLADYGSVVLPSAPSGAELVSLFVDRHVVVVDAEQVVPGMEAAFDRFGEFVRDEGKPDSGIVSTGPSATADMGALVRGAHGPSDVRVVVLEGSDE
jgi:L-lactate dehydrogenase complex protein LldG